MKPGDVIDGRYRVDRELGAGGMGVVLAATDLRLPRVVALKVLREETLQHPVHLARFEREARAAAMLRNEHVVRTLDVGKLDSGVPYMVLELLEGCDLEKLTETHPLPCATAVDYVLQACAGIAEAHANGIVHRDLKPQNLFLAERHGLPPIVKVLDFGISKLEGDRHDLTRTRDVMGTPLYMAPEQLRSAKETDARTDIWALGAILYRLVTGQVPFTGDTIAELCGRVLTTEPPPVRSLRPDAPDPIVRAIDRCLVKDPAARLPNVAELAKILDPELASPFSKTMTLPGAPVVAAISAPPPRPSVSPAHGQTTPLAPLPKRPLWPWLGVVPVVGIAAYLAVPAKKPVPVPIEPAPVVTMTSAAPEVVPAVDTPPAPGNPAPAPVAAPKKHRRGARPVNSTGAPSPAASPEDDTLPDMRK